MGVAHSLIRLHTHPRDRSLIGIRSQLLREDLRVAAFSGTPAVRVVIHIQGTPVNG